jgi:hypothetical protein
MGDDRASSSYLIERSEPQGRSLSAGYRFAKVACGEATSFRTETEATRIMRSIRNRDRGATYAVIAL